jgi:hypothetical protein
VDQAAQDIRTRFTLNVLFGSCETILWLLRRSG